MGLKLIDSSKKKKNYRMDIIAIPAIGADPDKTWRFPQDHSRPPEYIWSELKDAHIYLYQFDRPAGQQEYGITRYAEDLLVELGKYEEIGTQAIHFAAHSTGGLVLKRALVLAVKTFGDQNKYKQIRRNCSSIAFFGTPHEGSTILSDAAYKDAIKDELHLDKPLGNRLRSQLERVENLDELRHFSHDFQPLTLSMKKIWSFYEFRESKMRVKVVVYGPAGTKRTTSTEVRSPIVDKRSAVMTHESFLIGCEEAVPVNATHASLPIFGDNANATEFRNYIKVLKTLIDHASTDQSPMDEEKCRSIIEREVSAEVHQFYDVDGSGDSEAVRLWSVNPSLHELFEHGPSSFLLTRSEEAKRPMDTFVIAAGEDDCSPQPITATNPTLATNGLSLAVPLGEQAVSMDIEQQVGELQAQEQLGLMTKQTAGSSDDSQSGYQIPDPSQYLFRWIHIPANNMSWVEMTLHAIEKESALEQYNEAAKHPTIGTCSDSPAKSSTAETPVSEPGIQSPDLIESPITSPAASQLLKGAMVQKQKKGDSTVTDLLAKAFQDPAHTVELLQASQSEDLREPTELSEIPAIVTDIREQASMLKTATLLQRRKKERTKITTEHFVTALNEAVLEARETPSLAETLLHPKFWNLAQFIPNHKRPHGRHMIPGFHPFYPKPKHTGELDDERWLYSTTETAQFVLYFPYLHWDTFGCMKARNELVKKRTRYGLEFKRNDDILQGSSTEQKLIWQYLFSSADLPLHIRRTLDQFGYPILEDTNERDLDQVVFKWAKDATDKLRKRLEKSGVGPFNAQLQTRPSIGDNLIMGEDAYKVLMVDQLWCWIINEDTIVTFFPAKEEMNHENSSREASPRASVQLDGTVGGHYSQENIHRSHKPPSKTAFSPADLRDEIYDDMNGDPLFQKPKYNQCKDCLDFMARAVWHAVTLFLDTDPGSEPLARDLRIFQIFEERICDLTEKAAKAFKDLKRVEDDVSHDIALTDHGKAAKNLVATIKALNNSDDLSNLLEVQDVVDELHMLMKLFNQQMDVIGKMVQGYKEVDQRNGDENTHARARAWLGRAESKVIEYVNKCKNLTGDCNKITEMYNHLLDMKEKKANVVEASCARISSNMATRQGYAMMTFTIVTVLFLPLSFFTSLFGMNVRDWTGDPDDSTLRRVMILMGSASAAIILVALAAAFFPLWVGGVGERASELHKKLSKASPKIIKISSVWQHVESRDGLEEESVRSPNVKEDDIQIAGTARPYTWLWRGLPWAVRRHNKPERDRDSVKLS